MKLGEFNKQLENIAVRLYRLAFKNDFPIPSWLTDYLDDRISISRENKSYHQYVIDHANPEFYGRDQVWAAKRRLSFLRDVLKTARQAEELAFLRMKDDRTSFNLSRYNESHKLVERAENNLEYYKYPNRKKEIDFLLLKKSSLRDVVASYGINLIHTGGGRYKCNCPFHNEKTPSFVIFPDNHFHCFGCHKRGDVIDFIKDYENISTMQAVDKLL